MPAFGIKIDSIPGRLNETWFKATKTGVFYGQCSELCGINHAYMPIGPAGKPTELHLPFTMLTFNFTKYPQACKAFTAFLMEGPQFNPWIEAAQGYLSHFLLAYDANPVWTADPKNTVYRDGVKNMRPAGYAGKLGYASAGAAADFIMVNMVAEAVSGSKTPKEAMERAQKRAERYYKV